MVPMGQSRPAFSTPERERKEAEGGVPPMAKAQEGTERPPHPVVLSILRQDLRVAWKLSLETPMAGSVRGHGDPSRSVVWLLGFLNFICFLNRKRQRGPVAPQGVI